MGENGSGSITACFWDIQTCGQTTSAGGIGKTTAQMQTLATFTDVGWDFAGESANGLNDYWQIEVNGYPHFTVHAWTLEGEGTSDSPYIVANPADLGKVWLRPSACYRLAGNLDLSGISWSSAVVPVFAGSFEGRGFVISNLMINWPDSRYMGLFGKAEAGSQISNLGLENVNLTGRDIVGGLVGENDGTLTACYATGSVRRNMLCRRAGGAEWFWYAHLLLCDRFGQRSDTCRRAGGVEWFWLDHRLLCDRFGQRNILLSAGWWEINRGTLTACYATGSVSGT